MAKIVTKTQLFDTPDLMSEDAQPVAVPISGEFYWYMQDGHQTELRFCIDTGSNTYSRRWGKHGDAGEHIIREHYNGLVMIDMMAGLIMGDVEFTAKLVANGKYKLARVGEVSVVIDRPPGIVMT